MENIWETWFGLEEQMRDLLACMLTCIDMENGFVIYDMQDQYEYYQQIEIDLRFKMLSVQHQIIENYYLND